MTSKVERFLLIVDVKLIYTDNACPLTLFSIYLNLKKKILFGFLFSQLKRACMIYIEKIILSNGVSEFIYNIMFLLIDIRLRGRSQLFICGFKNNYMSQMFLIIP
jgi:hypothetical protein